MSSREKLMSTIRVLSRFFIVYLFIYVHCHIETICTFSDSNKEIPQQHCRQDTTGAYSNKGVANEAEGMEMRQNRQFEEPENSGASAAPSNAGEQLQSEPMLFTSHQPVDLIRKYLI